jgi:hypothetical protein
MIPITKLWRLGEELPPIDAPFAVLLSADDLVWSDRKHRSCWVEALLKAGCRYFVCVGENSEGLHDDIDEMIAAAAYERVITTFHDVESPAEVVEFFKNVARSEVNGAIALVQDIEQWAEHFESAVE